MSTKKTTTVQQSSVWNESDHGLVLHLDISWTFAVHKKSFMILSLRTKLKIFILRVLGVLLLKFKMSILLLWTYKIMRFSHESFTLYYQKILHCIFQPILIIGQYLLLQNQLFLYMLPLVFLIVALKFYMVHTI